MDRLISNETHIDFYDHIHQQDALDEFLSYVELISHYNTKFNSNIRWIREHLETIDRGVEYAVSQARENVADIEHWLGIYSDIGTRVKKNLDIFRKKLEEKIRETSSVDRETLEKYKGIILDLMSRPHWPDQKKDFCFSEWDADSGFSVFPPHIVGLVVNENKLDFTRNANSEIAVIQGNIYEINNLLTDIHIGRLSILLDLKLRAAGATWESIITFINEILSTKRYLIQDCSS